MSGTPLLLLATLLGAHLLAAMSPGPSFLLVAQTSAGRSRKAGLEAAFAMAVGAWAWACAAMLGLAQVFQSSPRVFLGARLLGGGFLLWTAVGIYRESGVPMREADAADPRGVFLPALRLQLSNPKVAIFFGSIFLSVLPADVSVGFRVLVLGLILINEFLWYAVVAVLLSAPRLRARYARGKGALDRASGIFLFALGLRLVYAALFLNR